MSERGRTSWIVYALAMLLAGAIAAAVLVVGPASGQPAAQTRTVVAQRGVVQSTVSGSGNVEAASQLDLGFDTSGTVTQIDVKQGQQVGEGQLIATLDPQSAEATLAQARASLQAAEADLAREEETNGESGSSSSSSGPSGASGQGASGTRAEAGKDTTAAASTASASTKISAATREANIASARAAVKSERVSVKSAEQTLADTKLLAPESGTIVSLGGEVGETASAEGTSRASSQGGSSGEGSSASQGAGGGSSGGSGSSSSASSSAASSSSFAVLSDLSSMKLVVPLSESEVGNVKRGQTATVTVEALEGAKLAAHVSEVAALPTSNSGVVSYDVTFQLDQLTAGLRAGMSATAEVVVKQAQGVNVPSSAISGSTVTVVEGAKHVIRQVSTGLAGDSSTIVLSGLKAGERVALPLAGSSGTSSLLSGLSGRARVGGLGGGAVPSGGGFAGLGRIARGGAGPGG